ncbi:hypothetical protein [Micromonospora sp. CPCC 206061]|uniref:hypothetical protein n=1 Tax=Micromonospora sp. CPCC 206061 TaxID=3122410 RepID=UPI002FEFC50E
MSRTVAATIGRLTLALLLATALAGCPGGDPSDDPTPFESPSPADSAHLPPLPSEPSPT